MYIEFLTIGKTEPEYLRIGLSIYAGRIRHYVPFEIREINAPKKSTGMPVDYIKQLESQLIIRGLDKSDCIILLDEHGQSLTSLEFSKFIQLRLNSGIRKLSFVVGGAWGFDDNLSKLANFKISLSKMTFSHQITKLVFTEQLYRAFTILKGEKYHNG